MKRGMPNFGMVGSLSGNYTLLKFYCENNPRAPSLMV